VVEPVRNAGLTGLLALLATVGAMSVRAAAIRSIVA
jgi:hypothetical protein